MTKAAEIKVQFKLKLKDSMITLHLNELRYISFFRVTMYIFLLNFYNHKISNVVLTLFLK